MIQMYKLSFSLVLNKCIHTQENYKVHAKIAKIEFATTAIILIDANVCRNVFVINARRLEIAVYNRVLLETNSVLKLVSTVCLKMKECWNLTHMEARTERHGTSTL